MGSLKVLKSIGHNTAHSYLSLMNYIDGDYTVERIYQIAKATQIPSLKIDILNTEIEPEEYQTPAIELSLVYLKKMFIGLLESDHIQVEQIKSAVITIEFDFAKTKKSEVTGLEKPSYSCTSIIEDSNGKQHVASIVEWWKY